MEKQMKMKFVFVLIVGIVLAFIVIKSFFGNNDEGKNDEFDFSEDEYLIDTQEFDSIDEDINDLEIDDEDKKGEAVSIEEEADFEKLYKEEFGISSFERAREIAQEVVKMWLEEEDDKTKWKELSTSSFFDEVQKELVSYSDGVKRQVRNLEIHAASPNEENEMEFGVVASWNILNGETVISQQTKLFYVTLTGSKDQEWAVKELVEV